MSSEGVSAGMRYTFTVMFILQMWTWKFVILTLKLVDCLEKTQIPQHLLECYKISPPLMPMNIETMTEILRKLSSNYYAPMSLTQQISDVLNWFSIDGLERSPNAVNIRNAVPYTRHGFQALKQNLLFEKLIPIQRRNFDAHSLSMSEKCTLHFMLSTTVDYWQRGDEAKTCPDSPQQFKNMSADGSGGAGMYSVCPMEGGVVLTSGGSVGVSRLLTTLLAALSPQQVPLSRLLTVDQLITHRLLPTDTISNVWAASLAGDLAEAAAEQSPLYEINVKIGISGCWNNTDIPTCYYFNRVPIAVVDHHQWQMTDAEILGGIDGLLLKSMIEGQGLSESNTMRLSQILEMYYSNTSVTEIHVCNRKYAFNNLIRGNKKTLTEQTERIAALLSLKTTTYYIDSSVMAFRCINAVERFSHYYPLLLMDQTCAREGVTVPRINLFLILDSTWPPYSTLRFIMSLTQAFDISYYGGRITVINGDSSVARVNSTTNPSTLYQKMHFGNQNDPKELRLHNSFTALKNIFESENIREKTSPNQRTAKQDVVMVLGYSSTVSDKDMEYAEDILKSVKSQNPAVQYIYIASILNSERFRRLLNVGGASNSDKVICSEDGQMESILRHLQSAIRSERSLKPAYCKDEIHLWPEVWYNEYITPGQTNVYWIHPDYFYKSLDIVKITFKTYDYGELLVCMTRGEQRGDCKQVGSDREVTHAVLRPCETSDVQSQCAPLYFTVSVLKTHNKCAEYECRYQNQVKFSIIVQDLYCVNLNSNVYSKACPCIVLCTTFGQILLVIAVNTIFSVKYFLL